ncbi:GUN4 domain-containing protein [Cylindrospermopsis raciborskii]|uniref:GUN4 domain-containing protein n=1 Tax=Cylindrospermopsis raciborskii TaxID=77022 RepID=UPI0008DD9AE4|nr:GUN4 domain-containing protein [Cylindrospermopsis raciborskii]OHY32637.1 hypothetical protein BCV64_02620 [Cylindrospermopsis raciborskii MVCC14]
MNKPQTPGDFDAVLGGTKQAYEDLEVLGGIEELQIYYNNPDPQHRIIIIQQALNYGDQGTEFLLEVLKKDDSREVKDAAYNLLFSQYSELAKYSEYIDINKTPQVFSRLNRLLQPQKFRELDEKNRRITIIQQTLNYGEKGSQFLLEVLKKDDSWDVKNAALNLLDTKLLLEILKKDYSWNVKDLAYLLLVSKDNKLAKSSGYIYLADIPKVFSKLNSLLRDEEFREANSETHKVILRIAKLKKSSSLRIEDAEKLPCTELRTIDKLWLKYSRGKFGISVQQEIYQSLAGKYFYKAKHYSPEVYNYFADRVGWRKDGNWLYSNDYNFSQTAPSGHLPLPIDYVRHERAKWEWERDFWNKKLEELKKRNKKLEELGRLQFTLLSRHAECNT